MAGRRVPPAHSHPHDPPISGSMLLAFLALVAGILLGAGDCRCARKRRGWSTISPRSQWGADAARKALASNRVDTRVTLTARRRRRRPTPSARATCSVGLIQSSLPRHPGRRDAEPDGRSPARPPSPRASRWCSPSNTPSANRDPDAIDTISLHVRSGRRRGTAPVRRDRCQQRPLRRHHPHPRPAAHRRKATAASRSTAGAACRNRLARPSPVARRCRLHDPHAGRSVRHRLRQPRRRAGRRGPRHADRRRHRPARPGVRRRRHLRLSVERRHRADGHRRRRDGLQLRARRLSLSRWSGRAPTACVVEPPAPYSSRRRPRRRADLAALRRPDGPPSPSSRLPMARAFMLSSPEPVRIDIPLDRPVTPIVARQDGVSRQDAEAGDLVQYRVTIRNPDAAADRRADRHRCHSRPDAPAPRHGAPRRRRPPPTRSPTAAR